MSGPNPVWNAPFLFDLPAGDITKLPLVFEFIIMQVRKEKQLLITYMLNLNLRSLFIKDVFFEGVKQEVIPGLVSCFISVLICITFVSAGSSLHKEQHFGVRVDRQCCS